MGIWQLTIDALDPLAMVRFWAPALGYEVQPPPEGHATWNDWYLSVGVPADELDLTGDGTDRIFDPEGHGPKIWFQPVSELPPGRHRFHLDLHVAPRDVPVTERVPLVEARVEELLAAGASIDERFDERPGHYHVTMRDLEGNVFCVA